MDDDEDDEDWVDEEKSKRKQTNRKKSTDSCKSNTSSSKALIEDENQNSRDYASELGEDVIKRIEGLKVKELQDALFFLNLSVTGRKDVLKNRLLAGLADNKQVVLPESYWLHFDLSGNNSVKDQLSAMDWREPSAKMGLHECIN